VREAAPVTSCSEGRVGQQSERVQRLLDRYCSAGIHRLLDRYHSARIHNTAADFYPGGRLRARTDSGDPNGKRQ